MNDKRKQLLIGASILLAGMFGAAFLYNSQKATVPTTSSTPLTAASPEAIPIVTPTVDPTYADWTLFRNGYAFPLPPDWKNTSNTGGRAVLVPGEKLGSIQEISVTVLSDDKAAPGQQFTTQREFEDWSAVEGEVQGPIQKLANVTVDSEKGIELLDLRGNENEWSVITWVRKDAKNVYITFKGTEKYQTEDAAAIDYILSHFIFTAPPMTGSEGK